VGFTPATVNLVGSAAVTVGAGETVEALCVNEWKPLHGNHGHQCILAAVVEPKKPPPTAFLMQNIAQRNFIVVSPVLKGRFVYSFQVSNPVNDAQQFEVRTRVAPLREIGRLLAMSDAYRHLLISRGEVQGLGLTTSLTHEVGVVKRLRIAAMQSVHLGLTGELEGQAALIHVSAEAGAQVLGGLSVLVVNQEVRNYRFVGSPRLAYVGTSE
jgi:hypothetical protein